MSKKRYLVKLSKNERGDLSALIRRGKGKVNALKRRHARALLKVDQGAHGPAWSDVRTCEALEIHATTVRAIRERFVKEGLDAALERKKQSRPSVLRKLDGAKEARVIALACSQPPEGHAKWSLRLLADKAVELEIVDSVSHETVRRALKKTNGREPRASSSSPSPLRAGDGRGWPSNGRDPIGRTQSSTSSMSTTPMYASFGS